MAHFAKLDANNVVTQVIVVANQDTADNSGTETESIGIAFCQKLVVPKQIGSKPLIMQTLEEITLGLVTVMQLI